MYDKIKLLEILLRTDFRTIDEAGKPYPPSNKVYFKVSEEMRQSNSNITAKHVYVIVNENQNSYKDEILRAFNIKVNDPDPDISWNRSSSFSIQSATNDSVNALSKEFDLILSDEQWKKIMPVRKMYGRRHKYILQNGWTDVIAEHSNNKNFVAP